MTPTRDGTDEQEAALRRLTAEAFGFGSWDEFRAWRKENPKEHRRRAKALMETAGTPVTADEIGLLLDLRACLDEQRAVGEISQTQRV